MKNKEQIVLSDLKSTNRDLFQKEQNKNPKESIDSSRRVLLIYINEKQPCHESKKMFLKEFISNSKLYDKKVSRFFGEETLSATPKNILGNHVFYHLKTIHYRKKIISENKSQPNSVNEIPSLGEIKSQEDIKSFGSLNNCKLWIHLAKLIKKEYDNFQGFVLFHPIQFIEYTASALSFSFNNLSKPVIFTGYFYSSKPVLEQTENLYDSLFAAGNYHIPEVCIMDQKNLLRANRSKKIRFNKIISPNLKPLGIIKYGRLMIDWNLVLPMPSDTEEFAISPKFEVNIGHLIYHPFITPIEIDMYFKNTNLKALVIECYGIGDLPNNNEYFLESLKKAIERGLLIYAITQCSSGYVSNVYVNNFSSMGIESGHDFIAPSIMSKLSWILGNFPNNPEKVKQEMQKHSKGEMTKVLISKTKNFNNEYNILTEMLFENITKNQKLQRAYFYECISPAIIKKLTVNEDPKLLNFLFGTKIIHKESMLQFRDYEQNNILHLFASKGTKKVWDKFISLFSSAELTDLSKSQNKKGLVPLLVAILSKNFETVKILETYLSEKDKEELVNEKNKEEISETILDDYMRHKKHDLLKLAFYSGIKDFGFIKTNSGTFLSHLAVLNNDEELLIFLIKEKLIDCTVEDGRGMTVKALAQVLRKNDIITFLSENNTYG
jgi:L-asparaginase/Glu-tRNA(Gln) amidotransferase subunit D